MVRISAKGTPAVRQASKKYVLVMIDSPDRIEEIIDRDVRDALSMIANTPLPGEETTQTPDEEDEDE